MGRPPVLPSLQPLSPPGDAARTPPPAGKAPRGLFQSPAPGAARRVALSDAPMPPAAGLVTPRLVTPAAVGHRTKRARRAPAAPERAADPARTPLDAADAALDAALGVPTMLPDSKDARMTAFVAAAVGVGVAPAAAPAAPPRRRAQPPVDFGALAAAGAAARAARGG